MQALSARKQGSEWEQKAALARKGAEEYCTAASRFARRSWFLESAARQIWDRHAVEEASELPGAVLPSDFDALIHTM
jgi:hypothetical protein